MLGKRRSAVLCFVLIASACSGSGGGGVPLAPHGGEGATTASLPVSVTVPTAAAASATKRPAYVSQGTASLAVFVYAPGAPQPATPNATLTVNPGTNGCVPNAGGTAITCTLTVPAPIGTAEVTLAAMSGVNGTGSILSQATQSVTVSVGMAAIAFTLEGTLAQIRLSLETPALAAGAAGTSILDVNAYDASGRLIVAPGNFATAVTVGADSANVTLSATTAAAPGTKITISYAGGAAPYAIHLSGTGGGVAANQLVGSTLYIEPSQSMAIFSGAQGNTGFGSVAFVSTTARTLEPSQSSIRLASTSTSNPQNGGVTVLPNGDYVVAAENTANTSCELSVFSASGALLQTTPYQGGMDSPTDCVVAATSTGTIVVCDGGPTSSQLEEFSVATNGALTSVRTIALVGSQVPSASIGAFYIAINASGQIVIVGVGGSTYYALIYAAGASGAATPTQTITLTPPVSSFVGGLAIATDGSIAIAYTTGTVYEVQRFTTGGTLAGTITPSTTYSFESVAGLALAGSEILVGWQGYSSTSNSYATGVDFYAPGLYGTSIAPTFVTPLAYVGIAGPVLVPAPSVPVAQSVASGDMLGYVASRAWTYLVTPQGGTSYYIGVYADPQLVNGNIRLVGFQSATSNPFSGGTLIGNLDFGQTAGWYSAVDFTSVSSGPSGTSGAIPGTPLFVPNTMSLGQTWNPLSNASLLTHTGVGATAQVTSVGAVPGMSACPNSPTQGVAVQYTLSATNNGGNDFSTVYYVPGCGITALQPGNGGTTIVLQSVGTQSSLGQQIVPPGQPPIVAALHALWQRTLGRPKPPR